MGSCDCQWNSADAKLRHAASAVLAMNTRAPMERVQDIGSLKILAQLRPDVRPKPSPVITLVFLRRFNKLEQPYHCSRSDSQLPNGNRLIKGCYFRLYFMSHSVSSAQPCDNLSRSTKHGASQAL